MEIIARGDIKDPDLHARHRREDNPCASTPRPVVESSGLTIAPIELNLVVEHVSLMWLKHVTCPYLRHLGPIGRLWSVVEVLEFMMGFDAMG